jgi:hypothetical protein
VKKGVVNIILGRPVCTIQDKFSLAHNHSLTKPGVYTR